jgi:hypothetical protein
MASALAYEQPSLQKAWEAFCAHLPTMASIWGLFILISGLGIGLAWGIQSLSTVLLGGGEDMMTLTSFLGQVGQMPFTIVSNLVYILFVAIPAIFYQTGEAITPEQAFAKLLNDPLRYLLAGALFSLAMTIGFLLCLLPGIAISFVMPVYVNRIFLTRQSIPDAFAGSFQAVYRSPHRWAFVGTQVLVGLLVLLSAIGTCGLGLLVTVPMSSFYIQNTAYHKGILS